MATFKSLPKKPKKPNLTKSSLETLNGYKSRVADWDKKCNLIKKYNKDLKTARENVKKL